MNETGHNHPHFRLMSQGGRALVLAGFVAAVLVAASLWGLMGGCADPRNEPLASRSPGYTETIVLWENSVSGGSKISAPFTVDQTLTPIRRLGIDHPARLTLVAYIHPDTDVVRYETVAQDSLPFLTDKLTALQVKIFAYEFSLDSALIVDSVCRIDPNCGYDTTGLGAFIAGLSDSLIVYNGTLTTVVGDTTRLGDERDSLGHVLDDRFRIALWMDNDSTIRYPGASFDTLGFLTGQQIFAAATGDSTSPYPGLKGRGFDLNLDSFQAADSLNPTHSLEVNWTQCFIGLQLPCMSVGEHTLYALVTGTDSRVTATLVLVYEEVTP
jgi:hypothetical protein